MNTNVPKQVPALIPTLMCLATTAGALLLMTLCLHTHPADAHGCMNEPNQRGSLSARSPFIFKEVDDKAPTDPTPHFPAGDKTPSAGAGLRSQMAAAGPAGWTPFTPTSSTFQWRAGVCGDLKGRVEAHLRGGKYFYGGKVVAEYKQGGVIGIGLSVNAHHNGFVELHICNADKCGGDISEACFREGHCTQLKRAGNAECDSGMSMACGPIDRNYPGRWYLPCSKYPLDDFKQERFGPGTILYQLPDGLTCEHCVLQWFWTAANTCNPPGVVEYFSGEDKPVAWERAKCVGQAGAVGGYNPRKKPCGGNLFPEEYLECADVRVVAGREHRKSKKGGSVSPSPSSSPRPVAAVDKPSSVSPPSPSPLPSPAPSASPAGGVTEFDKLHEWAEPSAEATPEVTFESTPGEDPDGDSVGYYAVRGIDAMVRLAVHAALQWWEATTTS